MPNAGTFAEILEAHLGCTDAPPPAARAWSTRPATPPLFAFELPLPPARPRHSAPALAAAVPVAAPPAAPAIVLTPLERRALEGLNELGAGLDDTLSLASLRRAFRSLARRYHPDANPGLHAVEHAQLARLFAAAREHYQLLSAALEARTH